nr:Ig-like domain-containing protein [Acetanaerobacterium elongatum]
MLKGKTMQFTSAVEPKNASNKAITYSVTDESGKTVEGVKIDKNGLLTVRTDAAIKDGFVKVTAASTDNDKPVTSNEIYVFIAPAATKVNVPSTFTAEANHFYTLSADAEGAAEFYGAIAWKSSNPAVAFLNKATTSANEPVILTVGKIGNVKSVTITATAMDGSGKSATIVVNFGEFVKKVTINTPKGYPGYINNGKTLQLSATTDSDNPKIKPATPGVVWEISDNAKDLGVSIDENGKITADKTVKNGKFTVTATAKDGSGVKGTIELEVRLLATGVTIQNNGTDVTDPIVVPSGDTKGVQLTAKATGPSGHDYSNVGVTWSISKGSQYAKVDKTGLVKLQNSPKAGSKFSVTATATDGSRASKTVEFTVGNKT